MIRYMEKNQEHFGKKFYRDNKTGYWISTSCPKIRAHRWVWYNVNGNIPKGFHIHHIDEDKSNNSIENLQLIYSSLHMSLHMTKEKRERASKWADTIRPLTKQWHSSKEGKAWHKYHAIKTKFSKWDPRSLNCIVCGKTYETKKKSNTKFCTNACKSRFRRDSGVDDITKICLGCKSEFKDNKYSKQVYCSRSCRGIH